MDERELLTPDEVAAHYKVSTRTVRKWVSDGRIKAERTPAGNIRIRRGEIDMVDDR